MGKEKNVRHVWGGSFILLILMFLTLWAYQQYSINYRNLDLSNKMFETMLNNQSDMVKAYKTELGIYKRELADFKEDLSHTEGLLAKVQLENEELYQKLTVLDKVSELEQTVNRLKERNVHLINHIASIKQQEKPFDAAELKNLEEAETLMGTYKGRVQKVKARIKEFKREVAVSRLAVQKEKDRIESLLGNNGYLVKNGEIMPMDIELAEKPLSHQNIQIDVSFVK